MITSYSSAIRSPLPPADGSLSPPGGAELGVTKTVNNREIYYNINFSEIFGSNKVFS
jgi:hypothetical protein